VGQGAALEVNRARVEPPHLTKSGGGVRGRGNGPPRAGSPPPPRFARGAAWSPSITGAIVRRPASLGSIPRTRSHAPDAIGAAATCRRVRHPPVSVSVILRRAEGPSRRMAVGWSSFEALMPSSTAANLEARAGHLRMTEQEMTSCVTPAKAGVQGRQTPCVLPWSPDCAGMTRRTLE
jgi:hypothetical protein